MKSKITYLKKPDDSAYFSELRERVKATVHFLPNSRLEWARFRALFFPGLYFLIYGFALANLSSRLTFLLSYASMGLVMVLVFLNLIHEAAHETLFAKKWKNRWVLVIFDLLGANSYIWKKRHILCHHGHQNISGWDSDIEQAGLFRVFPNAPHKPLHTKQHKLIFLVYPLYLINWVLHRDFKDFFNKTQTVRKRIKIPMAEYFKLFFFKIIFLGYTVLLPWILGEPFWFSLFSMIMMLLVAGVLALAVLLTPHANTHNEFPLPDSGNQVSSSWLEHQFKTTNDVRMFNWVSRNMLGNFNFHLAHHLFPNESYVYAPEITNIIEDFANQNGFNYKSYYLLEALRGHYQLIKNNSSAREFLEEDM